MQSFPWLTVIVLTGLFLSFWVGLGIFAWRVRSRGPVHSERVRRQGGSLLLSAFAEEYGVWLVSLPVRLFARLRVHPDVLTWAGLLMTLGAALAVATGHFGAGGWLFIFGALLDVVDGHVARRLGLDGASGGFLDSVLDRVGDMGIFFGLIFYYRNRPAAAVLCGVALIASTLISYMRAKSEALGLEPPRVTLRRPERVVYLGCGLALSPVLAAFVEPLAARPLNPLALVAVLLIAALGMGGAVRMGVWVRRQLRARDAAARHTAPTTA